MRYQLRYIRAQRARSSSGAKQDTSPLERTGTNREVLWGALMVAGSGGEVFGGALVVAGSDGAFIDAVDRASLPPRCRSAPVPWLSGRASASHAEGRWFDPSRDHKLFLQVRGGFASLVRPFGLSMGYLVSPGGFAASNQSRGSPTQLQRWRLAPQRP